jgi:hypothetical protein
MYQKCTCIYSDYVSGSEDADLRIMHLINESVPIKIAIAPENDY